MIPRIPRSVKWLPVVRVFLGAWALAVAFAAGRFYMPPSIKTVHVSRPPIAMGETLDVARANFDDKPFKNGVQLSELGGYSCAAWSKVADSSSNWVALICSK